MKSCRSLFSNIVSLFCSVISVITLTTCSGGVNVGLGASVDTQSPVVTITYPPQAAVIRDSFILAGTCNDDKSVKEVQVTLTGEKYGSTLGPVNAQINANNTWQLEVDPVSEGLVDDTYNVAVTIYDDAGHSAGPASQNIYIDNTAPVFVIKKPGVTSTASTYSKYGSLLTVSGTICDDHAVESMSLQVYDSENNPINAEPYTEYNISTSDTTTVTFARYSVSGTTDVNNRYTELYKNYDYGVTASYKCTVTLTDEARIYHDVTDKGSGTGNTTSVVYLYDDVYETLMSDKNGAGLSTENIKQVLNGTIDDEALANLGGAVKLSKSEIEAILDECAKNTSDTSTGSLGFTLNPKASPTYAISGSFAFNFSEPANSKTAASGQTLTATVNSGLDLVNIKPASIKAWFINVSDTSEEYVRKAILAVEAGVESDEEKTNSTTYEYGKSYPFSYDGTTYNWVNLLDNRDDVSASDTSFNFALTLPDESVENGKYYIIALTGCDKDNEYLSQETVYGFAGTSTGMAPSVSISDPENLSVYKTSTDVAFSGEAKIASTSDSSYIKTITATLVAKDQSTSTVEETFTNEIEYKSKDEVLSSTLNDSSVLSYDGSSKKWLYKPYLLDGVRLLESKKANLLYTLTVKVKTSAGLSSSSTSSVQIYSVEPSVKISSISPYVKGSSYTKASDSSRLYVNGSIDVNGSVNVQNTTISSIAYEVYAGDIYGNNIAVVKSGTIISEDVGSSYQISDLTIDTTSLIKNQESEGEYPMYVTFTAVDSLGNTSTVQSDTYYICQESDKPVIKVSYDTSINESELLANGSFVTDSDGNIVINSTSHSSNLLTSGGSLTVTLSDDDALANVSVTFTNILDKNDVVKRTQAISGTNTTVNVALPDTEGVYQVDITATDTKFGTADLYSNIWTTNTFIPFYIALTKGVPSVNLTSPVSGEYCNENLSVAGNVSKTESLINSVTAEVYKSGETTPSISCDIALSATSINKVIDCSQLDGGIYTVKVTAKDVFGYTASTESSKFYIDLEAPVLTLPATNVYNIKMDGTSYKISGTYDDDVSVEGVYYYIGNNPVPLTDETVSQWSLADINAGKKTWSVTVDNTNFASLTSDGTVTYPFYLCARDNYGHTTTNSSITLAPDSNAPVNTVYIKTNEKVLDSNYNEFSTDISVESGKTLYTKGEYSIILNVSDSNIEQVKVNGGDFVSVDDETGEYLTAEVSADSSVTYTFTSKDKAGNQTTTSVTVVKDSESPLVAITSPTNNENISTSKITGTVSDNGIGVKAVYYSIGDSIDYAKANVTGSSWACIVPELTDHEGSYTLNVYAEDQLGTISEKSVVNFYYDLYKPQLTETSVSNNGLTTNETVTLSGEVSDTNALAVVPVLVTATVDGEVKSWVPEITDGSWSLVLNGDESDKKLNDGSYIFTITATDIVGKTTTVTRSVSIDTTAPELTGAGFANSLVKLDESVFNTISVVAKDNGSGATGIANVACIVTASSEKPVYDEDKWTSLAQGKNSWTAKVDFTDYSEGTYYAFIRAEDNVGNAEITEGIKVVLDATAPVVTVEQGTEIKLSKASVKGDYASVDITINVEDTNPSVVIVDGTEYDVIKTKGVYVYTINDIAIDGTSKKIAITAKDENNRFTQKAVTVSVSCDAVDPVVTIADIAKTGDVENFTNKDAVTISGTAQDINLADVTVSLYKADGSQVSSSDLTLAASTVSQKWSYKVYDLEDNQSYYAYIKASDTYGNYSEAKTSVFTVDKTSPASSIALSSDGTLYTSDFAAQEKQTSYDLQDNGTYYVNGAFALSGVVTDDNISSVTVNGQNVDASKWTTGKVSTEGKNTYVIVLTDKAGNKATYNVNVLLDTTSPVVQIRTPSADSFVKTKSVTVEGSASDDVAGINEITYTIINGDNPITGILSVNNSTWSGTIDMSSLTSEGSLTLNIDGTDRLGNKLETVSTAFSYDASIPAVNEISAASQTVNSEITFAGIASDTNDIAYVTINEDSEIIKTINVEDMMSTAAAETKSYSYSYTFTPSEGTHSYTITATDVANRSSSSVTRIVNMDTTAPSVEDVSFTTTLNGKAVVMLDETKTNRFTAVVKDAVSAYKSGLSSVYYAITNENSAPSSDSDAWVGMAQGSDNKWLATVDFASKSEGSYYGFIKAVDSAKNETITASGAVVYVDEAAPVIFVEQGTDIKTKSVSNTLIVKVTDTNTATLTADGKEIKGTASDGYVTYDVNVEVEDDTTKTIVLTATDANGRTAGESVKITCDTVAPVLTDTAVKYDNGKTYIGSNKVTLTGTVTEKNLSYVKVKAGDKDEVTAAVTKTAASDEYTWICEVSGLEESDYTVTVTAADSFDNVSSDNSVTFSVDTSDPVLTETELGSSESLVSDSYILRGTVSDTNRLVSVKIFEGETETAQAVVEGTEWYYMVNVDREGHTNDGTRKYTIVATDKVGRTAKVNRTVNTDTVAPEINVTGKDSLVKLDESSFNKVTVSAKDNAGSYNTTVTEVAYLITQSEEAPSYNSETWTAFKKSGDIWSAALDFTGYTDGDYKVYVYASDEAGNTTVNTETVVSVDQSAPAIDVTYEGSSVTSFNTVKTANEVTVTVTDTNIKTVKLNGEELSGTATDGGIKYTTTLNAESNSISSYTFTAEDTYGRTAQTVVNVTCDTESPVVTYNTINKYYTKNTLKISGSVSDSFSGVDTLTLTLYKNGEESDSNELVIGTKDKTTKNWSWTLSDLEDAQYSVKAVAKDNLGNESTDSIDDHSFTVDTTAPVISTIVPDSVLYGDDIISAPAEDYGIDSHTKVSALVNGKTYYTTVSEVSFTVDVPSDTDYVTVNDTKQDNFVYHAQLDTDKTYTYTFKATDKAGNTSDLYTVKVVKDTTVPEITISTPSKGQLITSPAVTGTVSDVTGAYIVWGKVVNSENGSKSISARVSGNTWTLDKAAFLSGDKLIEGAYTLYVYATDRLGNVYKADEVNVNAVNVDFYYDEAVPQVNAAFTDSEGNAVTETTVNTPYILSGTASDTNALKTIVITDNGTTVKTIETTEKSFDWSYTPEYTDGEHKYVVTVQDITGSSTRVTQVTKSIVYDGTAPEVTLDLIGTPTRVDDNTVKYFYGAQSVEVKGSAKDAATGLSDVTVALYKSDNTLVESKSVTPNITTGKWSTGFYDLSEAEYYVTVTATDNAGNANNIEDSGKGNNFIVDYTKPVVTAEVTGALYDMSANPLTSSAVSTGETYYTAQSSYTINVLVNEANFKSITSSSGASGSLTANDDGTHTYSLVLDNLTDGTHTYRFTASDMADAQTVFNLSIITDTTAPQITLKTVSEGGFVTDSSVTFSGNITDTGVGTDKVYYKFNGQSDFTQLDAASSSWSTDATFETEGKQSVTYYAQDKLGNESDKVTVNFYYDAATPTVTETGINATSKTVNSAFTLSGTASDSNGIKNVVIKEGNTLVKTIEAPEAAKEYAWSYTFENDSLTDGTHVYTISATDVADRTSTSSITRTVNIDTTAPSVDTPVFSYNLVSLDESVYNTLTVKAVDEGTGATGLASVQYILTDSSEKPDASAAQWTSLAQGKENWSANVDFTGTKDQTMYYAWVKASDNAGNETISAISAQAKVDTAKPSLTINQGAALKLNASNGADGKTTITATVKDTNASYVTYLIGDKTGTVTNGTDVTGGKAFDISVSDIDTTGEEATVVSVTGYDTNGRTSVAQSISITCDATSPVASITDSDSEFINANSTTIRGTATDTHLNTVTVTIYNSDSIAVTGSTVAPDADGKWLYKAYDLDDGVYSVSVVADDTFGNSTHETKDNAFTVDTVAPSSTIQTVMNGEVNLYNSSFEKDAVAGFGNIYYADGEFTLNGLITETNPYTVSLSVNGVAKEITKTGNNWSYAQSADDGEYKYVLTLTDVAGNVSVNTITVYIDTTAPVIDITSPALNESFEIAEVTLKGSLSDNVSGIKKVTYSINGSTPFDATAGSSTWTAKYDMGENEGTFTVTATATDNLGHSTTSDVTTFYFDKAVPSLTETSVGAGSLVTNGEFVLSGTASDTNAMAETRPVTVSYTNGKTGDSLVNGTVYPVLTDAGIWSYTPELSDGEYTFTIVATDVAGKTSSLTRYVTVDTAAPTVSESYASATNANSATVDSVVWFNTKTIPVVLRAADSLSGISSVEYTTEDGTDEQTGSLTKKSDGSYAGTVNCVNQGKNIVTFTVTDNAGNKNESTELVVYVDTEAPSEPTLKQVGTETKNLSSSMTVSSDGKAELVVKMEASDTGSGIKDIYLYKIGSSEKYNASDDTANVKAVFENGVYTLTIDGDTLTGISSGTAKAIIIDNTGNSTVADMFYLDIDVDAPEIKISSVTPIAEDSYFNGTITLSGSIKDQNSYTGKYHVYVDNESEPSISDDLTVTGNNFEIEIDTTKLTDEKTVNVVIEATDKAGNTGYAYLTSSDSSVSRYSSSVYTISQDTDRPVVALTNVTLGSSMSESKRVILQSSPVIVTVSDDDGSIKNIYWTTDSTAAVDSDENWTELSGTNSYKIEFDTDGTFDGNRDIYIKIVDASDNVFVSNADKSTKAIKVSDGTNSYTGSVSDSTYTGPVLYFTIDTQDPIVTFKGVSIVADSYTDTDFSDSFSSVTLGGDNSSAVIKLEAYDYVNGRQTTENVSTVIVRGSINGTVAGQWSAALSDDGYYYCTINDFSTVSGTMSLAATVTDKNERAYTSSTSVAVDNTEPVISVIGPSSTATQSGGVTVYGTVDSMRYMYYALSTSDAAPGTAVSSWTNDKGGVTALTASYTPEYAEISDAATTWYVYFDGDTDASKTTTHADEINTWLVNNGITSWKNNSVELEDIVKLYVHIKAVDAVGNIEEYVHPFYFDPQGDRPSITVSYPTDGTSLGGKIKAYGTASDPDGTSADKIGIANVWMQIVSKQHEYAYTDSTQAEVSRTYGSMTITEDAISEMTVTKDDLDYLANAGYSIYKMKDYTSDSEKWTAGSSNLASGEEASDYGIYVSVTGSAWSIDLNSKNEFKPATGTNDIAIRVYAQDLDGKLSLADEVYAKFDASNPIIGNKQALYLVKSPSVEYDAAITAGREYTDGMYVKDDWYLIGSVEDDDGIDSLTLTVNKNSYTLIDGGEIKSDSTWSVKEETYTYESGDEEKTGEIKYFKYKLNTSDGVGSVSVSVTAYDKATGTKNKGERTLTINYDNVAPVLAGADSSDYKISPEVVQDNSFYQFGSKVSEETVNGNNQSGLDYVAFYFMRRNTTGSPEVDTIYNVKRARGENTTTVDASVARMGSENEGDVVYDSGLYWYKKTVERDEANLNVITVTGGEDENIMRGGLVKIGGAIYLINSVSDTTVTISGKPLLSETTAYFANALVVNNTSAENGSGETDEAGYYTSISDDDGDGMVERVKVNGTDYTWTANIVSKTMSDGPIELHYVAFDVAGNYSIGIMGNWTEKKYTDITQYTVTPDRRDTVSVYVDKNSSFATTNSSYNKAAFVANNAPRLAGVTINQDLDGNGTFDATIASETISTYSGLYKTYKEAAAALTATGVKAKGKVQIIPEILGGNGTLKYNYTVASKSDPTAYYYANTELVTLGSGAVVKDEDADYSSDGYEGIATITDNIVFDVIDFLSKGTTGDEIVDGEGQTFAFNIYDSTEGTVCGDEDSQKATLNVVMDVELRDSVAPVAKIFPFYWNNSSDNSLFNSSLKYGHIELESDLPEDFTDDGGPYDGQPKVSGKIKVSGVAHDNTLLTSLAVAVPGFNSGTSFTAATYSNGTWTCLSSVTTDDESALMTLPEDGWAFSVEKATYKEANAAGYIEAIPSGKEESDKVDYITSDYGHIVKWTLYIDTKYIAGLNESNEFVYAASDKYVKIFASDKGSPSLSGNTVVYTSKTSADSTVQTASGSYTNYYGMDVVPYITKVETNLASLKSNNWSVYNRTAKGHYPVYVIADSVARDGDKSAYTSSGETVKFYGFNLTGASYGETVLDSADDVDSYNTATLDVVNVTTSGKVDLTVNSVYALNNYNKNDAQGSAGKTLSKSNYATYAYNRQPNGDNNYNLTDDINFDVWQINTKAAVPISGSVDQPVMKINPSSGVIGFAFANGPLYFSMPGNIAGYYSAEDGCSYDYWCGSFDFFTSIGLAYDKNGNAYAVSAGGDINSGAADNFDFFTSLWGVTQNWQSNRQQYGSYYCNSANALEKIAQDNDGTYDFNKQRIQSPSIATAVHGNKTNVYIAYYDDINGEIRFKGGAITNTSSSKANFGSIRDDYSDSALGSEAPQTYTAKITNINLVAGKTSGYSTGYDAGEYVSIAVKSAEGSTTDDVVVLTWYDSTSNKLMYTYNTSPITYSARGTARYSYSSDSSAYNGWATPVEVFSSSNIGEYCKIAVDKDGGVHIAAYDSANANVMYAHASSYNASSFDQYTVDSYGIIGSELTLDVAYDSTLSINVPYISYYAASSVRPKIAQLAVSSYSDGVDTSDDSYTGNWEVSIVPTTSKVPEDHINVGVWKSSGVLSRSITTGTSSWAGTPSYFNSPNGYGSSNAGQVMGNGTANPVVGYRNKSGTAGNVEIAQMK